MITEVDYNPIHALQIVLRKDDAEDLAGLDLEFMSKFWGMAHIKKTLMYNDQVMAFMGGFYDEISPGTCHTFLITSDLVDKNPISLVRAVRDIHYQAEIDANIHRFQTLTNINHDKPIRWLEWLGYKREGLLRKCGANKLDRYIYARVS